MPLSGKELEGPSSNTGVGHVPIMRGHHPSYAEVARAMENSGVLLGKGKQLQDPELLGKAQHKSEVGSTDRGLTPPYRVAEGNARGLAFVSFPSSVSVSNKAGQSEKCDKLGHGRVSLNN